MVCDSRRGLFWNVRKINNKKCRRNVTGVFSFEIIERSPLVYFIQVGQMPEAYISYSSIR